MTGGRVPETRRQSGELIRSSSVGDRAEVRHDKVSFFSSEERVQCWRRTDGRDCGVRTEAVITPTRLKQ